MPETKTPARTDATGRLIREWNNERKICVDLEVEYTNAGAQVYIAEQNLRRVESERDGLMRERERLDNELAVLNREMQREKQQGKKAATRGAKIFGPIGAVFGAPTGPGSSAYFAGTGASLGGTLGYWLEELGDAINPNTRTDMYLDVQRATRLKKMHEIEKKLLSVIKQIEGKLIPEYEKQKHQEKVIRERLLKCRAQSR